MKQKKLFILLFFVLWCFSASCQIKVDTVTCSFYSNLKELYLDYNQIDSLPTEICRLEKLETLQLGHNRLVSLPQGIGRLGSLRFLYLNGNVLRGLPVGLGDLTNLVELNVANAGGLLVVPDLHRCQLLERLYIDQTTLFSSDFNPRTISNLEIIMVSSSIER